MPEVSPCGSLTVGLPEYRNGGLLVDYGLLKLTERGQKAAGGSNDDVPRFDASSPAIIEWRALTVIAL